MQRYRLHGPKTLSLDEVPRPNPGAGEVLVKIRQVGLCGSDKHYFAHGRCGAFVPKAPFALGHECSGIVAEIGSRVLDLHPGDAVAIDPLLACGVCSACRSGRANLCPDKRYMGSAAVWPHVDGALGEFVCAPVENVHRLPPGVSLESGAMIEPAAVAWHAVDRAGPISGKEVLVCGGGAIGQLILRIALARGAARATVMDVASYQREVALRGGASQAVDPKDLPADAQYDVAFEAAGSAQALVASIGAVRKGGVVVQVGTLPDRVELPANLIMSKELDLRGALQYHKAFPEVISLLAAGRLRVDDLITQRFPFQDTPAALAFSLSSRESIKIQVEMAP